MNFLKLTLLVLLSLAPMVSAQEVPQGYDPMSFREFWKPDPDAGIIGKVKAAKTIPQVQGIVLTAIKSQPTQLAQVAAAAAKGANTLEKAGCVIQLILGETIQIDPSKYLEIAKILFLNSDTEIQPFSAGFILDVTPDELKAQTAELLILSAPEATQGSTMQEVARKLGLETFNLLLSAMWVNLDQDTQQRLTIILKTSFELH